MQKICNDLSMAGIVLQVVILLAFATASANLLFHHHRALGNTMAMLSAEAQVLLADTECQLFAAGLVLAFITIFTRCCYRIAEMVGGWANTIMQNETDFVVPDGVMVLVVLLCLTILHPGFCFPGLATPWQSGLGDVNRHPARLCTLPRKTLSRQSL